MYLKASLFLYFFKKLFFSSHHINFLSVFNDFLLTEIKNILFQ